MRKQAFLIEIFDAEGDVEFRRIAMNEFDADAWIEQFAKKHGNAQVVEDAHGYAGEIIANTYTLTYKYSNIAIV